MSTLYRHATLWSGRDDEVGRGVDVLVTGGVIAEVGRGINPRGRDGLVVVDLEDRFLMPGLIDMHVHLVWSGSSDPAATVEAEGEQLTTVRSVANALAQVRAGITTVRDLGGYWDLPIALGRAIERKLVDGPSVVAAGQTVIMTGGHDPFWGVTADGPAAVTAAVRRQAGLGAGVIKVAATGGVYGRPEGEGIGQTELTYEELLAAAAEAHRLGLKVAAHALGLDGIRNAVQAGIDTIEHGNFLDEETAEAMRRLGTVLCPTLRIYRTIAEDASSSLPAYAVQKAGQAVAAHREAFNLARATGIPIVAGTDAGSCGTPHPALIEEMLTLEEYGMPVGDVLRSATTTAARALGRAGQIGAVAPGLTADMLILDADPTHDLANLSKVWGVVQGRRLRLRTEKADLEPSQVPAR